MALPDRGLPRPFLVAVLALALAPSLFADEPLPATLRVGMDTRLPPWSYVPGLDYSREDLTKDPAISEAQLQKLEGLEVDAAKAVGRRLGLPVRIVPVAWFDLEKGLVAKRYDVVLNAWTPNRQTPPEVAATEPYYTWGLLVATRATETRVRSFKDLGGRIVGCFQSVIADRTMQSVGAGELRPYESQEVLFDDLKAGKVEAVLYDSPYVRWRASQETWLRIAGEPLNRLGYHVAVRKAAATLLARVNAAAKDLVSSGESEKIRARWEGAPGPRR